VAAFRYLYEIEVCCQRLADYPELGRRCEYIRPRLRRMEQGRHVVFYRLEPEGILVSRILHQSMLPEKQTFDDDARDLNNPGDTRPPVPSPNTPVPIVADNTRGFLPLALFY
jgi:plasmid stabilization system protein ParE